MNISFFIFFNWFAFSSKMYCWNVLKRGRCFKKPTNVGEVKTCNEIVEQNFDEYLYHVEYKDTVRFIPPILNGKVIKVYDGDTITIASKIQNTNLPVYRFSVRLSRIDSAEIKGETNAEKEAAVKSRDALHELIFGKIVTLKNVGTEKYGRVLADVYLGELDVSKWMLDNNYAVPYDGGKKIRPVEWDNEI